MKHAIKTFFEPTDQQKKLFEETSLARFSVHNPNDLVLETLSARSYIEHGISQLKFSLSAPSLLTLEKTEANFNERVIIEAEWYSSEEANKKGIYRGAGKDANIFGDMGVLLVPENIKIPTVLANKENVAFYDLKLIENGSNFPVAPFMADTILMEYDYKSNYKEDFLTQENGGGGYYVETHHFPHIHIPLSSSSRGHIIIGKKLSVTKYSFTAFEIPYGYALYTPPGTIHGDGTLIGKYGISVAGSEISANTVLFFSKGTLAKINDILLFRNKPEIKE